MCFLASAGDALKLGDKMSIFSAFMFASVAVLIACVDTDEIRDRIL